MGTGDDLFLLLDRLVYEAHEHRDTLMSPDDALAVAGEIDQLKRALATRTEIGQAQGIRMERYGLSPEAAFAVLVRLSQHLNRKLVHVSGELVATGKLPPDPVDA